MRRPCPLHVTPPRRRRERGVFAVMTVVLLVLMLGFCGFAIDLGRMYNRKVELQAVADAVALAAAAELDGTAAGIARALAAAAEAAQGAGRSMSYNYNLSAVEWSNDAIRFGAAPDGDAWLPAGDAAGNAANLFYAEVDTGRLAARHGYVEMLLLRMLPAARASMQVGSRAVAGRSTMNVTPLALCAMAAAPGAQRGDELVEYGFRRGISYNLMKLNPDANDSGAHFLVNPVAPPGTAGSAVKSRLALVEPFVCTGRLFMSRLTGANITVERGFPLDPLSAHLNSRFGIYKEPCTPASAPPDTNVKEYLPAVAASWMTDKPLQSAASIATASQLLTVADLAPSAIPPATLAESYGPLWIYAKAARYAGYQGGQPEPAGGYATFAPADWATLYTPGVPKVKGTYPAPYKTITQAPPTGVKGLADRRILNVPLLRCPVAAGSPASAQVLAIARFYLTARATNEDLYGEFAGLVREDTLGGQVELYR